MASLQDRQEGIIVKLFDLVHEADSYQPPELSVGDRILKGKFKNSPAEITGFTQDKHNQPVLKTNRGEVQLFKPRVTKLMDKDVAEGLNETTSQLGPQLYTPHPKNLDESMKPEAALWTSTASGSNNGYTSAWVEWAKSEMPQWVGHSGFLYDVSPSARILTINSDRDAMRVANKYGMNTTDIMDLFMYMPWKKIAKDYDAIHHVPSNRGADLFMHSWDVESTAWFNTKMLLNKRKVPILASKKDVAEGLQNIEIQDDKSIVTISVGGKERFVLQPATGNKPKSYGGRAYKYWTIWDIERKKYRFDPNIGMPSKNQAIAYVNKIIKREEDTAKEKPGVAEDREYIPSGKTRITRHGIDLVVSIDGVTVDIRAMSGDSQMAYVVFDRDGDTLVADDLAVEEQYKGQGIAKIMYDYVKELGFRVKRSSDQLVAGKKFWDKNKGAKNNIWEQGMAEGLNEFTPDNGGEITERINQKSIQAGFKDHQKVMGGKFDLYADSDGRTLTVELHDPNADFWEEAAWARFEVKGLFFMKNLQSLKTWVEPQYRRMGLATTIYQYVQNLGNTIKPAVVRTDMGKAMWKGFKSKGVAEGTEKVNPLTNAVISFYKPVVDQIEPGAVDDYVKQAKELLNQAPDPTIRSRMLEIFKKGQKDPMIQGGVVTAIAAILTGGLLSSASRMGLSPAQTNILLQAVLNTVIPTIIARINNKSWRDTIKYTLASVGVGMTAAATLSEKRVTEGLSIDVPNEQWLQDKIDYAKSKGRDEWGAPFFGSVTAYVRPNPQVSVVRLELLKGMRNEQNNVRKTDLEWLMAYMEKTGKLPPDPHGNEYAPFVMVAYNGEAWVNEGNHRIMAAFRLGWKKMPIEIKYFDGGERVESGIMYPGKIGLGQPAANPVREAYTGPTLKWLKPGELRGSYTDQQMRDRGFDRAGNGKWFILQDRWNELIAKKGIQ